MTSAGVDWRVAKEHYLDDESWAVQMPDGSIWQRFKLTDRWGDWVRVAGERNWQRWVAEQQAQAS